MSIPSDIRRNIESDNYRIKEIPGNMHKTDFDASYYKNKDKVKRAKNNFMESIANDFNRKRDKRK